jgi:KaiC/GvpD/RAD55 family RecA-like ATPase
MGPDVIKAAEFDLSGMLAGIKAEADATGARRIVFDAVDALLSLLDDPLTERREIYRLGDWLSESGLTGIISLQDNYGRSNRVRSKRALKGEPARRRFYQDVFL